MDNPQENRTYYGEYSAEHWFQLMLTRKIQLPEYQRSLAWSINKARYFVNSLCSYQYIPTITLGHFHNKNLVYILDGQQRLTSILMARLGYYPDPNYFKSGTTVQSNAAAKNNFQSSDTYPNQRINWTFQRMLDEWEASNPEQQSIEELQAWLKQQPGYVEFSTTLNEQESFANYYLAFALIVPDTTATDAYINRFYAVTFRNMNYLGATLTSNESRRSLYYMDSSLINFFEGKTTHNTSILEALPIKPGSGANTDSISDFIRYIAILTQYHFLKNGENGENAKSANTISDISTNDKREQYYYAFINSILQFETDSSSSEFGNSPITTYFGRNSIKWQERYDAVATSTKELAAKLPKNMSLKSVIDVDYFFFGLLYTILFENKSIDIQESLVNDIQEAIQLHRDPPIKGKQKKATYKASLKDKPNQVKFLQPRMEQSIKIYEKYAQ
jgi:hypothetical protein